MPGHRSSQMLPASLRRKISESADLPVHGRVYTVPGGGLAGARFGLRRPLMPCGRRAPVGAPLDVQYALKDGIITRTEFIRGETSVPVHMAHFDVDSGMRFSTILDCF